MLFVIGMVMGYIPAKIFNDVLHAKYLNTGREA